MPTLNNKIEDLLGLGLSVQTITGQLNISYEKLCEELHAHPALLNRMKAIYPKYDFTVKTEVKKTKRVVKKQPKVEENPVETSDTLVEETNATI